MTKYNIYGTGDDSKPLRQSGFDIAIVIDATSPNEALENARKDGLQNPRLVPEKLKNFDIQTWALSLP